MYHCLVNANNNGNGFIEWNGVDVVLRSTNAILTIVGIDTLIHVMHPGMHYNLMHLSAYILNMHRCVHLKKMHQFVAMIVVH